VELCGAIIVSFNFTQNSTEPIKFSRLGGSQGMGEGLDKGILRVEFGPTFFHLKNIFQT
jgi:hypothetical protein